MAKIPENLGKELEQSRSRRGFFNWIGQVVAGASLAGIGLGLAKPLTALAAPDCTPCTGCNIISSYVDHACCPNTNYQWYTKYQALTGCIYPGQHCYVNPAVYGCATYQNSCPGINPSC